MNTPDAFTPDGQWVIGEAPEVANYFVCVGMNGNSLQVRFLKLETRVAFFKTYYVLSTLKKLP